MLRDGGFGVARGSESLGLLVAASWRPGDPGEERPFTAVLAERRIPVAP
ncbi:MAG: hypothetical protein ACRD0U_18690 [Acidimicrobiales bacterium]